MEDNALSVYLALSAGPYGFCSTVNVRRLFWKCFTCSNPHQYPLFLKHQQHTNHSGKLSLHNRVVSAIYQHALHTRWPKERKMMIFARTSRPPPIMALFSIPLDFTFFSDTSLLDYALFGKTWKKDTRIWCSPRCKDGQNCHCGRLSFHFPDIRSRWRLWRLKADHCALLSKRPIIIPAIFRPHQWLINCDQFSFPQKNLVSSFLSRDFRDEWIPNSVSFCAGVSFAVYLMKCVLL